MGERLLSQYKTNEKVPPITLQEINVIYGRLQPDLFSLSSDKKKLLQFAIEKKKINVRMCRRVVPKFTSSTIARLLSELAEQGYLQQIRKLESGKIAAWYVSNVRSISSKS